MNTVKVVKFYKNVQTEILLRVYKFTLIVDRGPFYYTRKTKIVTL